jgi:hypothetical protein
VTCRIGHARPGADLPAAVALSQWRRREEINEFERADDVFARGVGLGAGLGLRELHPELFARGHRSASGQSASRAQQSAQSAAAPGPRSITVAQAAQVVP